MFINLSSSDDAMRERAAVILFEAFKKRNVPAWPTLDDARREVHECVNKDFICVGYAEGSELLGWTGLRPMYETTWELHPIVVKLHQQHKGIGKLLLQEAERAAKERGITGIVLGSDDENAETSLSGKDFDNGNLLREIKNIKNIRHHPFEFFLKCGYRIIGVVPDANGFGKPDIWMWKRVK